MTAIVEVPADVKTARGHIWQCGVYRRERMAAARDWKKRGRPAMAHDAVQSAREWNRKERELARKLRGAA